MDIIIFLWLINFVCDWLKRVACTETQPKEYILLTSEAVDNIHEMADTNDSKFDP